MPVVPACAEMLVFQGRVKTCSLPSFLCSVLVQVLATGLVPISTLAASSQVSLGTMQALALGDAWNLFVLVLSANRGGKWRFYPALPIIPSWKWKLRDINMIGRWKCRIVFGCYETEEPFSWAGTPESFLALTAAGDQIVKCLNLNITTQIWPLKVKMVLVKAWGSSDAMDVVEFNWRQNLGKRAEFSQSVGTEDQSEIKYMGKYRRMGICSPHLEKLCKEAVVPYDFARFCHESVDCA